MDDKTIDKRKLVFSLEESFPDVDELFTISFQKLDESYKDALFVFDTNVLLLPYSMRNEGLEQLKKLYQKLIKEKRLFIPKRVAREFANNRNNKLAEIHHSVLLKKTGKIKHSFNYPILDDLIEKTAVDEALSKLLKSEQKYYKAIDVLSNTIKNWEWNDPVSTIYSELFKSNVLIDHELDNEELIAELEKRYKLQIPPGYKDSRKDDYGVGDLAIWLSLLKLGENKNKDIIFVSEDIKPDWWNQSNGTEFLPRYELIDEFKRKSQGKTLHIIRLSKLLELFQLEQKFIKAAEEAAEKERKAQYKQMILRIEKGRIKEKKRFNKLGRQETIEEIKGWFFQNYEDPAESCPYETKEGGYQYIWGGPYDAREEIDGEFNGVVSDSIIDEIVNELENSCWEWSAVPNPD